VRQTSSETEIVVASDLTLIECDRVLRRAAARLASVLVARSAVAGLALLSLDEHIRGVGKKLGLPLLPKGLARSRPRSNCRQTGRGNTTTCGVTKTQLPNPVIP